MIYNIINGLADFWLVGKSMKYCKNVLSVVLLFIAQLWYDRNIALFGCFSLLLFKLENQK